MNRKNQKGIGLIALTITIIVMVILIGVTLIASFAEGGVIDRAQQAMKEHENKEIKEIIMSSFIYQTVASATNAQAYLDLDKTGVAIYDNLTSNGFVVTNGVENESGETTIPTVKGELDVKVEGNHGDFGYVVDKEGNIKENHDKKDDDPELIFLRDNLIGETVQEEWLGTEQTINEATITFDRVYVSEETAYVKITNIKTGNSFNVKPNMESLVIESVDNIMPKRIQYGKTYINDMTQYYLIPYENGTFSMGFGDEVESGEADEYNGGIYSFSQEANVYMIIGNVNDDGTIITISLGSSETLEFVCGATPVELKPYGLYISNKEFEGSTSGDSDFTALGSGIFFDQGSNVGCGAIFTEQGLILPIIGETSDYFTLSPYGTISHVTKDISSKSSSVIGKIDPETLDLEVTNSSNMWANGTTIKNSLDYKYDDEKYDLNIFNVNSESVSVNLYGAAMSGGLSYYISDNLCYVLMNNSGMYVIFGEIKNFKLEYSEGENPKPIKLTIAEYDSTNLKETSNMIEYAIDGKTLTKVN